MQHKAEKIEQAKSVVSKKNDTKKKSEVKPRSWYLKEAQKWFNKFIRLRDANEPCISCGRHHNGQYHAGHYRSVGSSPELRFNEMNCQKQCAPCNSYLSGNIINYRPRLIDKIGVDAVNWLEGPHEPSKFTIDDLKDLIKKYKQKCSELEKPA